MLEKKIIFKKDKSMELSFFDFINNLITTPSFLVTTILISAVMFINGITDVPNSIATCVATRSLSPKKALEIYKTNGGEL